MCSPSTAATVCRWRVSIVPVTAMPTLPPMFRIRLNRLVAFPIRCGSIGLHRRGGQRHERQRHAGALQQLRPEDVPVAGLQIQLPEPDQREAGDEEADREQLAHIDLAA